MGIYQISLSLKSCHNHFLIKSIPGGNTNILKGKKQNFLERLGLKSHALLIVVEGEGINICEGAHHQAAAA